MAEAQQQRPWSRWLLFSFIGLLSPAVGILVGLTILPDGVAIHLNFFSVIELCALAGYLVVSMLTYSRIFQVYFTDAGTLHSELVQVALAITILSVLLTFLAGVIAAACASMPHLHLAGLVALVGSFTVFDLLFMMVYSKYRSGHTPDVGDAALENFAHRVEDWFKHTNLPTLASFAVLYSIVAIMVWVNPFQFGHGNHTYEMTEAFSSGAATFHLVLLTLIFSFENRSFIVNPPSPSSTTSIVPDTVEQVAEDPPVSTVNNEQSSTADPAESQSAVPREYSPIHAYPVDTGDSGRWWHSTAC